MTTISPKIAAADQHCLVEGHHCACACDNEDINHDHNGGGDECETGYIICSSNESVKYCEADHDDKNDRRNSGGMLRQKKTIFF